MAKIINISMTIPENILKKIDKVRGQIKRSNYIASALQEHLNQVHERTIIEKALK